MVVARRCPLFMPLFVAWTGSSVSNFWYCVSCKWASRWCHVVEGTSLRPWPGWCFLCPLRAVADALARTPLACRLWCSCGRRCAARPAPCGSSDSLRPRRVGVRLQEMRSVRPSLSVRGGVFHVRVVEHVVALPDPSLRHQRCRLPDLAFVFRYYYCFGQRWRVSFLQLDRVSALPRCGGMGRYQRVPKYYFLFFVL